MKKSVLLCALAVFTLGLALPVQAQTSKNLNEALITAVQEKNLKEVKNLIAKGADVNAKDSTGETPLFWSVLNIDIAKFLISHGADVNAKDSRGQTPLFSVDNIDMAKLLVSQGAKVDIVDNEGRTIFNRMYISEWMNEEEKNKRKEYYSFLFSKVADVDLKGITDYSPLHSSASLEQKEDVEFLLSLGANINVKDVNGLTPIDYTDSKDMHDFLLSKGAKIENLPAAIVAGNLPMVKDLVAKGADVNPDGNTPLFYAIKNNQNKIAKYLISAGADINAKNDNGTSPMHIAAQSGNIKMAKFLLKKGAQLEAKDNGNATPLYYAAASNQDKMVKYLLSKGANPNAVLDNWTALWFVCSRGKKKMVETLLAGGADVNYETDLASNPVDAVVRLCGDCSLQDKEDMLKTLIKYGADINAAIPHSKWNVLDMEIVLDPNIEKAQWLVKMGADVNKGKLKGLYMITAVRECDKEMARFLINNGLDIDITNDDSETALDRAIIENNTKAVKWLFELGAKMEKGKHSKWYPLIAVRDHNNREMLEILINNQADLNVKNDEGKTPLDYAKSKEIKQLLIFSGAKNGKDLK